MYVGINTREFIQTYWLVKDEIMHSHETGMKKKCYVELRNIICTKIIINQSKVNKLPEAQSKTVTCFLMMAQHMFVDKTTAQHIFAYQA